MSRQTTAKRLEQMRRYSTQRYYANRKLKGRSQRGRECKEYFRAWRIKAGQCMDCGFQVDKNNYYLIDADHRPNEIKRFNVSSAHKWGLQSMIDELAKCDPVCCRCHRIRTHDRATEFVKKGWVTRLKNKQQLTLPF